MRESYHDYMMRHIRMDSKRNKLRAKVNKLTRKLYKAQQKLKDLENEG